MEPSASDGAAANVTGVYLSGGHTMAKQPAELVTLVEGEGVLGDAHRGVTVKHRSRVRQDPTQPNLRQVHLVMTELLEAVRADGFDVAPGAIGENIATVGIDLFALGRGTRIRLGDTAEIEVTGLRNPCGQLNGVAEGLMGRMRRPDPNGGPTQLCAGIMAIVLEGGDVAVGDPLTATAPTGEHIPLERV